MNKSASIKENINDERINKLNFWLRSMSDFENADIEQVSGDASFRRYFRVRKDSLSFIAMDSPPEKENCGSFLKVANFLDHMSVNVPRIIESNIEEGFLLLSDLGSQNYLDVLIQSPESAKNLYEDAIKSLHKIQHHGKTFQTELPPYDEKLLKEELSIFYEWLCSRHIGLKFGDDDMKKWLQCCDELISNALKQPKVFVHRDFHSRNLMKTKKNNPGIVDFQDAVEGPITYDIVSLLRDCYISWPETKVQEWCEDYYFSLDHSIKKIMNFKKFIYYFDLMGVHRHLKAAGIFFRLHYRDGKSGYIKDVPRTINYIYKVTLKYPELSFLRVLIKERCMPALRKV